MKIETEKKNDYLILRIKDELDLDTNVSELKKVIEDYIKENEDNFAISMSPSSNLSSMSIGVILQCYQIIKEKGGKLAIIHPNKDDFDLLETLKFTCVIETYRSEEEFLMK